MKEQLHTIPISDAMANAGECPLCYIERRTEEHMMDFVLGHIIIKKRIQIIEEKKLHQKKEKL